MTDVLNPLFFQQNVNAITSIKMCVQTHTPFHTNYNAFIRVLRLYVLIEPTTLANPSVVIHTGFGLLPSVLNQIV